MTLSAWNPMREMFALRDAFDRMFDESFARSRSLLPLWSDGIDLVPVDMYEEEQALVIKATVAGIKPEDLNVQVRGDRLTISGETTQEEERKEQTYHLHERRYGKIERSLTLPCAVLTEKAEANFADGVLTLRLPKAEETRATAIPIKSAS